MHKLNPTWAAGAFGTCRYSRIIQRRVGPCCFSTRPEAARSASGTTPFARWRKQQTSRSAVGVKAVDTASQFSTMDPAAAKTCSTLDEYRRHMTLTSEQLGQIVAEFEEQMKMGLKAKDTDLLMIPTMVDVIPDGHETGEFFGVEISGSQLRVVYTQLSGEPHTVVSVQDEETPMPDEMKHCPADELFDFMVERVMLFATRIGRLAEIPGWLTEGRPQQVDHRRDMRHLDRLVLGLCFSFPMQHETVKSGKLIKWTKGYENEGAVGKDPVRLLTEAFKRQNIRVSIGALVNDTVGILCGIRYTSGPDANIAVIMGTGTNACYVEQTRNISKWRLKYFTRTPDMVVNIEWPGFHSHVLPLLTEDVQLDQESSRPGDQAFEKLTAGLYMGDIARRILHRLASSEGWFGDQAELLKDPSRFSTIQLANIAQDEDEELGTTATVLGAVVEVSGHKIPDGVRKATKEVCRLVTERSAQLTAAAIVGILHHIERSQHHMSNPMPRNIIAVEGGIFSRFHLYRGLVHDSVRHISGDEFAANFELKLTEGGAAFGAATIAAAGFRYDKVMGHVEDAKAPPRKFPPRGRSHSDLSSLGENQSPNSTQPES